LIIEIQDFKSEYTKTAKGGYNTGFVNYVNDRGESKTWKLMSFANPKVYDTLKSAVNGDRFDITTGKNDKDFTVWADAQKLEGAVKGESVSPAKASTVRPTVSTYETADERAVKQRLIVRQSSLGYAIQVLANGGKSPPDKDAVKALADEFVAYVYDAPTLLEDMVNTDSDIPF
jgi:hypothetical protein